MDNVFHKIDGFILEKISEGRLPGLSLAVVKDGEVVYSRGYGFRDVSGAVPADEDTLYGIASITKSFTALAVMQLAEAGKLSLSDPVSNYIEPVPEAFSDVTIHHLLTHSSGIPALGYAEAYIRGLAGLDDGWLPVTDPRDVLTFMVDAEDWREGSPGEKFFYLNEGYVALGMVVESVSGLRYEDYVRRYILEPLEMSRTYFSREEVERDGGLAKPYIVDESGNFIEKVFPYGIYADGGLISNVVDLAKYLTMYLGGGMYKGRRIVGSGMLEAMEEPYIRLPYEVIGGEAYGYGWRITPNFYGHKLVGHSGSVLVHTGYVGYIRDEGVAVAVLANGAGYPLSFIGEYVLALLIGEDPTKLPYIWKDRVLKGLEGEYQLYRGTVKARVVKRGSILYLVMKEAGRDVETPLFPIVLGEERSVFKTISNWREYNVEFRSRDGVVEFLYERYKFRRL